MKSETTLVGTESGVELDTIATVDLEVAIVVLPNDTELDDTLRDGDDIESNAVLGVLLEENRVLKSADKLCIATSKVSSKPILEVLVWFS